MSKIKRHFNLNGVTVTEWNNPTDDGKEYSTFSFEKRYKDKSTGEWKSLKSFSTADLSVLYGVIAAVLARSVKVKAFTEQKDTDATPQGEQPQSTQEEISDDVPF